MARSKITIDFGVMPPVDSYISIREKKTVADFISVFLPSRYGHTQVALPQLRPGTSNYIRYVSTNYTAAFNADYDSTRTSYQITTTSGATGSGLGTVVIVANYDDAIFEILHNNTGATITIENQIINPPFELTSITYTTAPNSCTDVIANVQTSVLATNILSPIVLNNNTNNPFNITLLRGQVYFINLLNELGQNIGFDTKTPDLLNASNFNITISNSPNGSSIVVTNENTYRLILQYSLNNTNWQTENVFGGLLAGNFTLYIKDQLGCSIAIPFVVDEFGINEPSVFISKSNAFRFAKRVSFETNFKNEENTLSCETECTLPYKIKQYFKNTDIIPIQFSSSYKNNTVSVIKENGVIVNIPVEKKTNNIGLKDKRDAFKYSIGGGKTGIYFLSGNKYNYDTNAVLGTYALNGDIPEWAKINNYLIIQGIWHKIDNIFFDEEKKAYIIVINLEYTGGITAIIVGSVYNRLDYDVYESDVNMSSYLGQTFNIKIENSTPTFPTVTHLSESVFCSNETNDALEIIYYNATNTDVFYSTGIIFKTRVPFVKISGKSDENSEVYKTDTNAILLDANVYEVDEFLFHALPIQMCRKLIIALSHEKVFINSIGYVKNGSFSLDGPKDETNLYILTATMLKTGFVYNSKTNADTGIDLGDSTIEIPGLITTNNGYLKY